MSSVFAIAAVTSTLRNLVSRAVNADVPGAQVTARPPDKARQATAGNQVNLFLYRTSIDAALRNEDPPNVRPGEGAAPPLPLVLSYLVTAYGENDDELLSHQLLGSAMRILHDQPVLSADDIRTAIDGRDAGVQVERVRITPHPIPLDEVSRLWATFQTGYRISASYDAAVVVIDSRRPARAPIPVLARGQGDIGPVTLLSLGPTLRDVLPPNGQLAVRAGERLTLVGRGLAGVTGVRFTSRLTPVPTVIAVVPGSATDAAVQVDLPTAPALPAGGATAAAIQAPAGAEPPQVSNDIGLAVAPAITSPMPLTATAGKAVTFRLTCAPPVQAGQSVSLVVGQNPFPVPATKTAVTALEFVLPAFIAGTYPTRLRVDGVDSIVVDFSGPVPVLDPTQQLVVSSA
jgi:hypothetical protein